MKERLRLNGIEEELRGRNHQEGGSCHDLPLRIIFPFPFLPICDIDYLILEMTHLTCTITQL